MSYRIGFLIYGMLFWSTTAAQTSAVSNNKFILLLEEHTVKIPIYANANLYLANPAIKKAVIVIHGTNRNADDYFANMKTAAELVPELSSQTIIVAPQFLTETDIEHHLLDDAHLYWSNGGWKAGSNSRDEDANPRPVRIPSYAVLDSLMLHLVRQFPSLERLTLTGHSAGGQVVQRMAATSPLADLLCADYGVHLHFVVANPSSYVYMDEQRRRSGSQVEFSIPNTGCGDFNEWKYGLEDLYTYPDRSGADSIRARFQRRQVTYLLGEADNNPASSSLDMSCAANLQGSHRLERGIIYYNYLQHYYGAAITDKQALSLVPEVGHSNFEMYNSTQGVNALFNPSTQGCGSIVGTRNRPDDANIDVFPNPASERVYLSGPGNLQEPIRTTILDLRGRQIWTGLVPAQHSFDVTQLNAGLYVVLLQMGEVHVQKKLVVQ